jgi:predicted thioesterase
MTVEITVSVTAIEGRKVVFAVTARDNLDTVCSGSHARFVVDKAKTVERLRAKAAKLAAQAAS